MYCCRAAVPHTFNPSTWETEAGESLCVQGQPGLQSEFQDSPDGCTAMPGFYLDFGDLNKEQGVPSWLVQQDLYLMNYSQPYADSF